MDDCHILRHDAEQRTGLNEAIAGLVEQACPCHLRLSFDHGLIGHAQVSERQIFWRGDAVNELRKRRWREMVWLPERYILETGNADFAEDGCK